MKMEYSAQARKNITETSEGYRAVAYPDPGTGGLPWTIGYGHTDNVHEGDTCSQFQADYWLSQDISVAEGEVYDVVIVPLSQFQFDALVDFCFNEGFGNLERSTLLKKLNAKDYAGADEEFHKWIYGGGHKLPGLVARRQLEANWFITGAQQ